MFMLNLLFNFNDDTGSFADFEGAAVLERSKHWLKVASPDPPGFNPENAAQFEDLGKAGSLFMPHGGNPHVIGIRIAPLSAIPIAAGATLDIAVCFGRPVIVLERQRFASPFVDAANAAVTVFQQSNVVRTAGVPGWFLRLGPTSRRPGNAHLTDRYEFALGITVKSGGVTRTYGEDPEFDVGT